MVYIYFNDDCISFDSVEDLIDYAEKIYRNELDNDELIIKYITEKGINDLVYKFSSELKSKGRAYSHLKHKFIILK